MLHVRAGGVTLHDHTVTHKFKSRTRGQVYGYYRLQVRYCHFDLSSANPLIFEKFIA